MTSDRDKCGLSSLLPMSCRGRAEEFARRLHSRLSSLGSTDSNGTADENSWLAASENPLTISQPRQSETDFFFDFGDFESPGSPDEELDDGTELEKIINHNNLKLLHSADCHCSVTKEKNFNLFNSLTTTTSYDSDSSDGPFYDSENDFRLTTHTNGNTNETESEKNDQIVSTETTSCNCNVLSNHQDPASKTSLPDEVLDKNNINEESSIEENNETYSSCLTIEKKFTVECPNVVIIPSTEEYTKNKFKETVQSSINNDDGVDDDETEAIPRVRRCSSLKTGKTPPGTPGRKKIVRFADVLGLDLADVRTFLDEIPKIPNSAYTDLKDVDLNESAVTVNTPLNGIFHGVTVEKILVPLFQQPGGQCDFIDRIRDKQVCLDNALVDDPVALTITGTVRVKNLDFNKSVHIRYTLDSWQTFADVQAIYVENSCDGFSDKFSFLLFANSLPIGQKLEFAIRFQCKGTQYWDNNNGINYCFQCLPATSSTTSVPITDNETDNWGASFYY